MTKASSFAINVYSENSHHLTLMQYNMKFSLGISFFMANPDLARCCTKTKYTLVRTDCTAIVEYAQLLSK